MNLLYYGGGIDVLGGHAAGGRVGIGPGAACSDFRTKRRNSPLEYRPNLPIYSRYCILFFERKWQCMF
jgi:hypothetical protein